MIQTNVRKLEAPWERARKYALRLFKIITVAEAARLRRSAPPPQSADNVGPSTPLQKIQFKKNPILRFYLFAVLLHLGGF